MLKRRDKVTALSVVLTLTLLLCHGIFGVAHLPAGTPSGSPTAHESHAGHGIHTGHDDGGLLSAHHEAEVSYFAVVFWLSVALAASLLRFGMSRRTAPLPVRRDEPRLQKAIPLLPRGPTLSRLQVFRL